MIKHGYFHTVCVLFPLIEQRNCFAGVFNTLIYTIKVLRLERTLFLTVNICLCKDAALQRHHFARIIIGSYSIMVSILALIKSPLNQCLIAFYLLENEIILQCKGSWMQLKEIVLLDLHQTFISLTTACICFCQLIVMIHFYVCWDVISFSFSQL